MNALDRHAFATAVDVPRGASLDDRPRSHRSKRKKTPWDERCERWGILMTAAQKGVSGAYDKLLRELDPWLRRYYERRLPACNAEDARQDALLAIHASLHTYKPSKPFGPWVATIARYKWIDHVREASRHHTIPLDEEIFIEHYEEPFIAANHVDRLIGQLKPAQARVIRLVKLQGVSIHDASVLTGQTSALVKVNVHRGLKMLSILAKDKDSSSTTCKRAQTLPKASTTNHDP
jgi:RNA polymerase sigma factor (sigma-70 family)